MRSDEELSTNYKGRCGNCHASMRPGEKYCKFCGTPKGAGKFEPYRNVVYCVYGPPIKQAYKCKKCSHKWATAGLGGSEAKYCPRCGTKLIDEGRREVYEFGDFIGTIIPKELPDGYRFLSEEEVKTLLDLRTDIDEESEETAKRIVKDGFSDWDKAESLYDEDDDNDERGLTEIEAGRANLERIILEESIGINPQAMHKKCPRCSGNLIAGIRYKSYDKDFNDTGYADLGYPDENGDGVYCEAGFYWRDYDTDPKYQCLQCGKKFI